MHLLPETLQDILLKLKSGFNWLYCNDNSYALSSGLSSTGIVLPNKNYILPPSIAMWPPAWWSWLVLLILLLILTAIGMAFFLRYRKRAYRREALALLTKLASEEARVSDAEFLTQCHQIIRRCLVTCGRKDLAALASHDLFKELDSSLKTDMRFDQFGEVFLTGAYQPNLKLTPTTKNHILAVTKYWCRRHNA